MSFVVSPSSSTLADMEAMRLGLLIPVSALQIPSELLSCHHGCCFYVAASEASFAGHRRSEARNGKFVFQLY